MLHLFFVTIKMYNAFSNRIRIFLKSMQRIKAKNIGSKSIAYLFSFICVRAQLRKY